MQKCKNHKKYTVPAISAKQSKNVKGQKIEKSIKMKKKSKPAKTHKTTNQDPAINSPKNTKMQKYKKM